MKQLAQLKTPESDRKYLIERLRNPYVSFQTSRTNATLTSYAETIASPVPTPNNAVVNATGFHATDHMKGQYAFGKLRKVHLQLVRDKIVRRGGVVEPKLGIRALGKYLQGLEVEQQRKTYREQTGNDTRDEDLTRDSFKPHAGTAAFNALLKKE